MCTVSRRGTEALSTSGPSWANDALSHAPYPRFLLYGLHQLKRRLNLTAGNHPAILVFWAEDAERTTQVYSFTSDVYRFYCQLWIDSSWCWARFHLRHLSSVPIATRDEVSDG